ERVDVEAPQAFTLLVDAETQAAADRLAALALAAHLADGAKLEDVRVVPALAQGGVRKDELQLRLKAQQFLLVFHDQAVGALCVFTIALVILGGVRPRSLLVDGEITVVNLRRIRLQVNFLEQGVVLWLCSGLSIFLLKHE